MEYFLTILSNNQSLDVFEMVFGIERKDKKPIDFNIEGIGCIPSIKVSDMPMFLNAVVNETGLCMYEYSGFSFGPITEAEKVWLEAGYVEIYVMDAKTILTNQDFFELSLEFAHKALEAVTWFDLKDKGLVDNIWINSIKEAIPKLEAKLKNMP